MQAETAETSETSETVPLRGISEATAAEILAFRDDRRWLPYHNPKDLAMSVAIEAGELLEVFQWSGTDLERGEKRGELADELADRFVFVCLKPIIKPRLGGEEAKHHLGTLAFKRRHCRLHQAVQQFVSAAAAHQCHDRILH